MRVGVHLPQYGPVSSPESIHRAAVHAEKLGFSDVWVSDHIVHPAAQTYPSPYLYDPLLTLAWAGAATTQVGLGTSVLVAPTHNPLALANSLASLDSLCAGRLTIGVGVGWSEAEYDALGYDFASRGDRLDEMLDLWREVWRHDPASFHGKYTSFDDIRLLPKPVGPMPVWVGGASTAAYRRGIERGDGFHLVGVTPETAPSAVARLREARPDPSFTISLRTEWDPQRTSSSQIQEELAAFTEAGVQHVVAAPSQRSLEDWLRSMDQLAEAAL